MGGFGLWNLLLSIAALKDYDGKICCTRKYHFEIRMSIPRKRDGFSTALR